MSTVAIIGSGFAGLAAAYTLRREDVSVQLFADGLGASGLHCGAFDFHPWKTSRAAQVGLTLPAGDEGDGARELAGLDPLFELLGIRLEPSRLVSCEGVLRTAAGSAVHALNLERVAGGIVGVLDLGRSDWDAARLAMDLARTPWAQRSRTRFVPIELTGVFERAHRSLPLAAFCRLLDDEQRANEWRSALAQLQQAQSTLRALLCGPWLGTGLTAVGLPHHNQSLLVGEALSPPDGPMGARFHRARERLCSQLGVEVLQQHVARVTDGSDGVVLEVCSGSASRATRPFDGAIVASGGWLSGGLELRSAARPETEDPRRPAPGRVAGSPLYEGDLLPAGAFCGQDLTLAPGSWIAVGRASGVPQSPPEKRVQFAGDVLQAEPEAPTGSIGSAMASGRRAAQRILKHVL